MLIPPFVVSYIHMSEETLTTQTDTNKIEDDFSVNNEWQAKDAAEKAQRLINMPTPEEDPKSLSRGKKIGTALALIGAAGLGAGGTAIAVDHSVPGKEVASATSTVFQGEGVQQSVYRDIAEIESKKIDPADPNERQDVTSQAVAIHSDANNIVQPGENITVIAEKSPIFGNITYKAVENPALNTESNVQLPLPPATNTDDTIPAPITH